MQNITACSLFDHFQTLDLPLDGFHLKIQVFVETVWGVCVCVFGVRTQEKMFVFVYVLGVCGHECVHVRSPLIVCIEARDQMEESFPSSHCLILDTGYLI